MDITHDNVCSSMLSCFYSHLLSTGRPISSLYLILEVYNLPVGHSLFIYFILVIRLTELFVFDYPFYIISVCLPFVLQHSISL